MKIFIQLLEKIKIKKNKGMKKLDENFYIQIMDENLFIHSETIAPFHQEIKLERGELKKMKN
jgi:hypothetical protein